VRDAARTVRVTTKGRLFAIRTVHSAVFLAELASILWLVVSGIKRRGGRSVGLAAVLVSGESAVFVANRGVCPLTPLAERYGANRGAVSDIFLPDIVARTIPVWATSLVVLGAALHVRRLRSSFAATIRGAPWQGRGFAIPTQRFRRP
jgi:hypothetical protein